MFKDNLYLLQENHPDCEVNDVDNALKYLAHYGYLLGAIASAATSGFMAVASVASAVSIFQEMAGIPVTGRIDKETLDTMQRPRCGVIDVAHIAVEEARWRKTDLKYFVADYVGGMSKGDQDDLIKMAWKSWTDAADIKLTQVSGANGADIVISTGRGRAYGFDGPSGTLAWAYLPPGNDQQLLMRFDLDERWVSSNPSAGILYLNVAAHEFGHLLGLDHSRVSRALMAPIYSPSVNKPQENDDIPRIVALYGKAQAPTPPDPTPVPPVPTPAPTPPVDGKTTIEVFGKVTKLTVNGRLIIV